MEKWREVFRKAIAPQISDSGLEALRTGLESGDDRLVRGITVEPPSIVSGAHPTGACAIGYCGWIGDGLATVNEVEDYFTRVCFDADKILGESGGTRWFLNFFDGSLEDVRVLLLEEVESILESRHSVGNKIIDRLNRFADALDSRDPIPVTRMSRIETLECPAHLTESISI